MFQIKTLKKVEPNIKSLTASQLRRLRKKHLILFTCSSLLNLAIVLFIILLMKLDPEFLERARLFVFNPFNYDNVQFGDASIIFAALIPIASVIGSITSLVGIIITTGLAWKKDKRDRVSAELDNQKKQLEIEKLRWELEQSKVDVDSKTSIE